ncbi:hypothetical protein RR48_00292 [Papilio machaon]|uniref:Uncharacterized protein n=1 Tax=Papilio machaon TaxID=76193 RepID=A0A0N1ID11_PAPMA|nr:hypothetical protein RR48_00292 [Papilio machaon]
MGIFTRAVRTAINSAHKHEPQVEYASDSDEAGAPGGGAPGAVGGGAPGAVGGGARTAHVDNLPHGITDTRLKTLAGDHVQVILVY